MRVHKQLKVTSTLSTSVVADDPEEEYVVYAVHQVALAYHCSSLWMDFDTGATLSFISQTQKEQLFPAVKLRNSDVVLHIYSERLNVVGEVYVHMRYGKQMQDIGWRHSVRIGHRLSITQCLTWCQVCRKYRTTTKMSWMS